MTSKEFREKLDITMHLFDLLGGEDRLDVICHERTGALAQVSDEIYDRICSKRQEYLSGLIMFEEYEQERRRLLAPLDQF